MADDVMDPETTTDDSPGNPEQSTDDPNTESQPEDGETSLADTDAGTEELPKWHHSLPAPLKGHEALKGYATIGEAAAELAELKGRVERMVEIPADTAPLEEREAFYEKIGRPKNPGEYELKKPENWPPNLPWRKSDAQAFAESAYKAGLPKAQAEQMHRQLIEHQRNATLDYMAEQKKVAEKREARLQEMYGSHVDENVKVAHRAMEVLGSPALKAELEQAGLLRSPQQVATWAKVWNAIGEDKIFAGAADPDGKTQEARIKALYPNTDW